MMNKYKLMAKLSKGDILDIGFAQVPNKYLTDAIGVDIQKTAKPKNYRRVYQTNLNNSKLPFNKTKFDTVLAGDIIEHLENPSHFLRECNRVLPVGGKLILSAPHADYWWTILHNWFFFKIIRDPDEGEHLNNWTKMDMLRLLKLNGFKCIRLWGTHLFIPKINLKIPLIHFPTLSFGIIYETIKIKKPVNYVLTLRNNRKIRIMHYGNKHMI